MGTPSRTPISPGVEVLEAEPAAEVEGVTRGGIPRWGWPVLAAAVVAAAIVVWLVPSSPSSFPPEEEGTTTPSTGLSGADLVPPTTARGATTIEPSPGETARADQATPTSSLPVAPVLGDVAGLSLYAGNNWRLQRIDLDTGAITELAVRGLPLLATENWLVLATDQGQSLAAVSLADPDGAEPVSLGAPVYGTADTRTVVPSEEADRVWIARTSAGGPSLDLVDLATGSTVTSADVTHPYSLFGLIGNGGPLLVPTLDGGIFEYRSGEARPLERVAEGILLAANDEAVLRSVCSLPSRCELDWLDRADWRPDPRPTPAIPGDEVLGAWLSPSGRFLLVFGRNAPVLYDVEEGESIEWATTRFSSPLSISTSPDERFLAIAGEVVHFLDLETGQPFELELPGYDNRVVLVESP